MIHKHEKDQYDVLLSHLFIPINFSTTCCKLTRSSSEAYFCICSIHCYRWSWFEPRSR